MMLLFFALALTTKQQAQHDLYEWKISQQIETEGAVIADMWLPHAKLLADYRKAKKCYVQFHLYRTANCSVELEKVETELGNIELANVERQ